MAKVLKKIKHWAMFIATPWLEVKSKERVLNRWVDAAYRQKARADTLERELRKLPKRNANGQFQSRRP